MKTIFKWLIIIVTVLIFLYAFSTSYSSESIDHLDYVIAIGIDTIENSDNLQYSFEFANISSFSENASPEDSKPIINKATAPTISGAINIINSYVGKQINLSHCKVIIFSEEVAKKGLLSEVSSLMNNTQIRPTINVLVSEGEANKYIENSSSSLEKVLTKYYDIFPTSSEYTGYTSNVILGELYDGLINKDSGATAILGRIVKSSKSKESSSSSESSSSEEQSGQGQEEGQEQEQNQGQNQEQGQQGQSQEQSQGQGQQGQSQEQNQEQGQQGQSQEQSQGQGQQGQNQEQNESGHSSSSETTSQGQSILEGDRGTENIGLCVLKDCKDVGHLTAMETLCYSMLIDEVDNFYVRIKSPFDENKKIDLSLDSLSSTQIDIDTSKENPIINIKLNITGEALNGLDNLDYSQTDTLEKINNSLKEYLSSEVSNYLKKTSKDFKVDINGFYKKARKNFLTMSDFNDYNWAQKYENAEFNVEINSDVISSRLIQNS